MGDNTIKATVTVGGASQTYTLTVTRAADTAAPQPTIELDPDTTDFRLLIRFGEGVSGFDEGDISLSEGWTLVSGSLEADGTEAGTYRVGFRPEQELAGLTKDLTVTVPAGAARELTATPNASLEARLKEADLYAGPGVLVDLVPFRPAAEGGGYDPGSIGAGEFQVGIVFIEDHILAAPVSGFDANDIALTNASVTAFLEKPRTDADNRPIPPDDPDYAGVALYEATIVPDAVACASGCTITVGVPYGAALGGVPPGSPDIHLVRPSLAARPLTVQRQAPAAGSGARVSALAVRQDVNEDFYRVFVLVSGDSRSFEGRIKLADGGVEQGTIEMTGSANGLHSFWARPSVEGPVTLSIDLNRNGTHGEAGVDFTYVIGAVTAQARSEGRGEAAEAKIPDAALRGILGVVLGKEAGEKVATEDLAALRSLDLRGSGVADLTGLEHAVNLTDLYLDDLSLDLSPLDGLGVVVHAGAPTPAPDGRDDPPPLSTDATLRGLALTDAAIAFDPATESYAVGVGHDVTETTVTATPNDDGASYLVKLDGAADNDGVVPLAEGSNFIAVTVTAEDGETTQTYTVTVTRAEAPQPQPAAAIALSAVSVTQGTEITVTMSFANLERDADTSDVDYIFRADVKDSENGDADGCEDRAGGYGLGVDRYIWKLDEDPEVRTGTVSAGCPAGDYTLRASVSSPDNVELASASAAFSIAEPQPQRTTGGSRLNLGP